MGAGIGVADKHQGAGIDFVGVNQLGGDELTVLIDIIGFIVQTEVAVDVCLDDGQA